MKKSILILAALISALTTVAQEAIKLQPEKYNDYALTYYLPQTVLNIEVVATKTSYQPGPYFQYAQKYLGTSDVITHEADVWEIISISATPHGEANTANRYQLTFKPKQTPYIFVSPEHTILSINTTPATITTDTVVTPAIATAQAVDMTQALTEEMLMSGSVAKMAELAAKQIYRIRESRMNILTGEADNMPADGESMRIIIEQLEQQEQSLTALFTGTKSVEVYTKTIKYTPQEDIENHIIMRFSDHLGFVDANNLSGAPIYLSTEITKRGEYPVDINGVVKTAPKGAIAYNIPGEALISISYEKQSMVHKKIQVAQLGVIYGLDPALFVTKKEPAFVVFDPYTGGIQEIGTISEE